MLTRRYSRSACSSNGDGGPGAASSWQAIAETAAPGPSSPVSGCGGGAHDQPVNAGSSDGFGGGTGASRPVSGSCTLNAKPPIVVSGSPSTTTPTATVTVVPAVMVQCVWIPASVRLQSMKATSVGTAVASTGGVGVCVGVFDGVDVGVAVRVGVRVGLTVT